MNPVLKEAAGLASGGVLLGVTTVAFILFFTVVLFRILGPGAKTRYLEVAQLPLEHDTTPPPNGR